MPPVRKGDKILEVLAAGLYARDLLGGISRGLNHCKQGTL